MATLRVHDSTEYWKKTDLMVKPASYPIAVGYDVSSVDTIHRPLTLDLSEVCHEDRVYWAVRRAQDILLSSLALVALDDEDGMRTRQGDAVMLLADNAAVCPPMFYAGEQLSELHIEGKAVGLCRGL